MAYKRLTGYNRCDAAVDGGADSAAAANCPVVRVMATIYGASAAERR